MKIIRITPNFQIHNGMLCGRTLQGANTLNTEEFDYYYDRLQKQLEEAMYDPERIVTVDESIQNPLIKEALSLLV